MCPIDRSKSLDRLIDRSTCKTSIDHIILIKNNKRTRSVYICSIYQSIYIVFGGYPNTKKNNSFNLDIYIKIKHLKAILKIYL